MTPRRLVELELKLANMMFDQLKVIHPMVVFVKGEQRAMMPAEFHSELDKDQLAQTVRELVKRSEPDCVVYIAEAWAVISTKEEVEKGLRPMHHPNREEIVFLQIEFKTGEKYSCEARIVREKGEARLDKWNVKSDAFSVGRFVDFYPIGRTN